MKQSYHFLFVLFLICFTTKLYSQSVPSYVPTNGLVGWWGFNGNAQDGSGNGNHGTVNGATLTTDRFGNQNGAYSFDGIDDRIDLPLNLNGALLNLSQFTLTGFILKNSTDERTFFSNWKSFPLSDPFGVNCAIGPGIKAGNCSGTGVFTTNHIISGEWYNVSIVFDGLQSNALNRIKLFINGYQQLSDSGLTVYSPFVVSSSLGNQATHTAFGSHFSQFGWWAHLDGKLDNIGIWNRALTQQEITNLYNSQLPTQTSLCLPTITTNTPTSIGIDSVVIGGDILNDGGSFIVLRGVCYSTTPNPNMGNPRTEEGSGIGSFTSTLRNLSPSTTYYARSYAKNSQGVVVYGNEVTFTTTPLAFGMTYAGGIIFDLDSSGQHGLVCAPSDQGAYPWGCYGTDIPNTSTAVGTGATSTANIVAGCAQRPIAASVCADLVLNGYSDWYLPSLGELQLMYSRLHLQGLGGFGWDWYWSSSQYGPYSAWAMDFYGGNVVYSYGKGYNVQVRAVRSF